MNHNPVLIPDKPLDDEEISMTLLDYFAGHALSNMDRADYGGNNEMAGQAYRLAQAMLDERIKRLK